MLRIKTSETGKSILAGIACFVSKRKFGKVPTPLEVTAHHKKILRGYILMEHAQEGAKTVPSHIKLLAQIRTATLIGCPFLIDIGSAVGRKLGLTDQKLTELQDYVNSSQFDETEKAVLRYADAMTKTPAEIPDEIFEKK